MDSPSTLRLLVSMHVGEPMSDQIEVRVNEPFMLRDQELDVVYLRLRRLPCFAQLAQGGDHTPEGFFSVPNSVEALEPNALLAVADSVAAVLEHPAVWTSISVHIDGQIRSSHPLDALRRDLGKPSWTPDEMLPAAYRNRSLLA